VHFCNPRDKSAPLKGAFCPAYNLAQMRCYLSLGSNLGNRRFNLEDAISRLEQHGHVVKKSSFYETEPVDMVDQPWFLNCVVEFESTETPELLLSHLLDIERQLGRVRDPQHRKGPRLIDIDILLFEDKVVRSPSLTIPHPAMHERRFVLEPLAEIAPQAMHPELDMTAQELLNHLPSQPAVRKC
jgi:2-amino-4-hydroxy-6-hydroxymethyldihydropteridine diphosphokinase